MIFTFLMGSFLFIKTHPTYAHQTISFLQLQFCFSKEMSTLTLSHTPQFTNTSFISSCSSDSISTKVLDQKLMDTVLTTVDFVIALSSRTSLLLVPSTSLGFLSSWKPPPLPIPYIPGLGAWAPWASILSSSALLPTLPGSLSPSPTFHYISNTSMTNTLLWLTWIAS